MWVVLEAEMMTVSLGRVALREREQRPNVCDTDELRHSIHIHKRIMNMYMFSHVSMSGGSRLLAGAV